MVEGSWTEQATFRRRRMRISEDTKHVTEAVEVSLTPTHVHRWHIETPNGPTSRGHCAGCNSVREFPNSTPDWGFQSSDYQVESGRAQRNDPTALSLSAEEKRFLRDTGFTIQDLPDY